MLEVQEAEALFTALEVEQEVEQEEALEALCAASEV